MSDKTPYYQALAEFIVNTDSYLRFLATKYPFTSQQNKKYDTTYLKSTQFYSSSLSHQLDTINKLPDLNQPELKKLKQKLITAVIDLQILKHTQETTKFMSDNFTLKQQQNKHSITEKWFNRTYNDSLLVLKKNNNIYCLELTTDKQDKTPNNTFYNHLPENIEGTLQLFDMKMSTSKYQTLTENSSDDDEMEDNPLNNNTLIENYNFSSKTQFLTILQNIKDSDYQPFYNLT